MEFNTGKPPAGEAGMCYADGSMWKRWDGVNWLDGHFINFHSINAEQLRGAHAALHIGGTPSEWRWATLAEITAAGIPESEARGMVHKSMLPEAAADAEWGPWIFCERGSKCPIPHAKAGEYAVRWTEGGKLSSHEDLCFGDDWDAVRFWDCAAGDFAYRLKRTASQVGTQSTGHAIQPNTTRHHTPKPVPADHIPWHGKGLPNIPPGTLIRYLCRGGADGQTAPHCLNWSHDGGPMDVIAYRPVDDGDAQMLLRDMAEHKPRPVAMRSMSHEEIRSLGRALARQWTDRAVAEAAWVERDPFARRLGLGY